jgi:hypothetical protein
MDYMVHTALNEFSDVIIVQRIENLPPDFPRSNQSHQSKIAEMMGDCGFANPHIVCQTSDIYLSVHESSQYSNPTGITQRLKQLSNSARSLYIKRFLDQCFHAKPFKYINI